MKKALAILLFICMVLALAACGSSNQPTAGDSSQPPAGDSSQAPANQSPSNQSSTSQAPASQAPAVNVAVPGKDTVTIAITQDSGTLDPMYMQGQDSLSAMMMVYEPLWIYNGAGEQIWKLATGVEYITPEIWHIKLREGITFSNGNPFDAEDALFSVLRQNTRVGQPRAFALMKDDECRVVDQYTIELVFEMYDFTYLNSFTLAFMFDKESYDDEAVATTPVGTGPYELEDYVINSHIYVTKRDEYWGDMPAIQNFHFVMLKEDAQRVNALQTGEVDAAKVPFQDIDFVQSLPGINLEVIQIPMVKALYFNVAPTSVFYDNVDARKAVAYAIDRDSLVKVAYSGFVDKSRFPLPNACIDTEDRFKDIGIYGDDYKPDLARQLAESSGLLDKDILLINNGSADEVVMCELIQANLKDIGITCTVNNLDMGSWASIVFDNTQYDMAIDFARNASCTVAQGYQSWITNGGGYSYVSNPWPQDERALDLIIDMKAITDEQVRSERCMELTYIHIDAMLWYALIDNVDCMAFNADLAGDYSTPMRTYANYQYLYWAQ